jgi:hypothetical protein
MFVDMENSTGLKYRYPDDPNIPIDTIYDFLTIIAENSRDARKAIKFTGDGAMLVYDAERVDAALDAASKILQAVERRNISTSGPKVHCRAGIATGDQMREVKGGIANELMDLIGIEADLAARLCSEALRDAVLTDDATKSRAAQRQGRHFKECKRRLVLKGAPPDAKTFWDFFPERITVPFADDKIAEGLFSLYPNRTELLEYLAPARVIRMTVPRTTVVIAGRTLKSWTALPDELKRQAQDHDVTFRFLLSSLKACEFLEPAQLKAVSADLPEGIEVFEDLVGEDPAHFHLQLSPHLILDGLTSLFAYLPGQVREGPGTLLTLQDVNAAAGDYKAALLWACTCRKTDDRGDPSCTAHGLRNRTMILFDKSSEYNRNHPQPAIEESA